MKKWSPSVSHEHEQVKEFRKNPDKAVAYLNACVDVAFDENDPALVLTGLAVVARAYGITRLARESSLQRESLHRMLSLKGNPEWASIFRLFRALHFRPHLERIRKAA